MSEGVDLGQTLERAVSELVTAGRYSSKREVLREGVRLVQEREAALASLDAGIASGLKDTEAGLVRPADEVFARLSAKYEQH